MAESHHKRCTHCGTEKPLSDFPKYSKTGEGRLSRCRECNNAIQRARRAASERTKQIEREFHRARRLRLEFGLTVEQYEAMLAAQGGKCAICDRPQGATKYRHAVDHCHATGRIRGLLCSKCNQGLGFLGDTAERVAKALDYLLKYQRHGEAG